MVSFVGSGLECDVCLGEPGVGERELDGAAVNARVKATVGTCEPCDTTVEGSANSRRAGVSLGLGEEGRRALSTTVIELFV